MEMLFYKITGTIPHDCNNKSIVLEAVKENGLVLQYASFKLRDDFDIVYEAVQRNGNGT